MDDRLQSLPTSLFGSGRDDRTVNVLCWLGLVAVVARARRERFQDERGG